MEDKKDALTLKEQLRALHFILKFMRSERVAFMLAILMSLAAAVLSTLAPFVIRDFMDNHLVQDNTTMRTVYFFAVVYIIVTLFRALFSFGQFFVYQQATFKVLAEIRLALYKKIHTLGMHYFDQTPTGRLITRITNDTNLFDFYFVFLMIAGGVFSVISAYIALFMLDSENALVMLVFLPLILLAVYLYQYFSSRIYRQMRAKLSELNTKLNEYISGMRIIQQFRQEKRLQEEFERANDEYFALRQKVVRTNALLLNSLVNFLLAIATITALGIFGVTSFDSMVAAGVVYAFIMNLQAFFNPIGQMMDFLSIFSDGLVASHRIQQIMNEESTAPMQNEQASESIEYGKIEFRNVSFSYDGEREVLKNISFVIEPGETLAFVGHTGSGKSSIINIFMRFYEFQKGKILIDDKDIREYPIEELRKQIGLVLQDAFLFVGDINSNIRLMNEKITNVQIEEAARFTQAHHFIERLEGQYEAKVIENGESFSSGERQLLNFARTIVTNPKILVLDEATANVDTETENLIQTGLGNMREGRTTIAIAHRLSTIKDADKILVLDKGEIVEEGNHERLMEKDGYYAEMYRLQSEK